MKLKDGIIITETQGAFFAVDAGIAGKRFNGMIKMNETAACIAQILKNDVTEEQLADELCERYDVSKEDAQKSVATVLASLKKVQLIEE